MKLLWISALVSTLLSCTTPSIPAQKIDQEDSSQSPSNALNVPDNAAGRQLLWILASLNERKGLVKAEEVSQHFSPVFLAKSPETQTVQIFSQLSKQMGPITLKSIDSLQDQHVMYGHGETKTGKVKIVVSIDPLNDKMNGLFFQPD